MVCYYVSVMRTKEQVHDISSLPNPNASKFSKTQKVGFAVGGAVLGLTALNVLPGDTQSPANTDSAPVCVPFGNQMLQVQKGEGLQDIAYKIDGVTDGDPANDPCEPAKEAIIENEQHSDMLQPGETLHLPIGVYPQGEVPEGSVMYTVDPE